MVNIDSKLPTCLTKRATCKAIHLTLAIYTSRAKPLFKEEYDFDSKS